VPAFWQALACSRAVVTPALRREQKLIGAGLGAGLFVLNAIGAWEWAMANQFTYNIRIISNSYGSFAPFDPTIHQHCQPHDV